MTMNDFELERQQRIETNRKRMLEMGIQAMASKIQAPAPIPAPPRKRCVKAFVPEEARRRSTRERVEVNYAERYGLEHGDDDDDVKNAASRARANKSKPRARLVSMSDGDHARVRYSVGRRVYDSELGTTCHWCRQKTVETHVTCTADGCGRGRMPVSFCGMCLRNRHGEDIDAAVASNAWVCPKCRGSCGDGCVTCCNCGPCRKANGLAPTHQVINLARASGFDNVHDYLVHGRTGETPAQLLERKRTFDWGRWLLCDFVPATPADSETDLRESEDDTSAACDDTDPFDDTPCLTCGGLDRPEDFVLCDGCDQGGHFDCVGLAGVPDGDWFCARCDDSSSKAAKAATTAEKAFVNAYGSNTTPVKQGPGRPRKRPLEEPSSPAPLTPSPTKRGPGRPRVSPNPRTPPSTGTKNEKVVKVINQKVVQQDIRHAFAAAKRSAGKRSAAPKPGAMALPVRPYKRRDGVGA